MTLAKHSTPKTSSDQKLAGFQREFAQYLRSAHLTHQTQPSTTKLSDNTPTQNAIPTRVATLYKTLVFNNIRGFLDQCFPVCQSLIDNDHWLLVCQQFFAHHPCQSPYFTNINQSFVDYLTVPDVLKQLNLPTYFAELAHYEWIELMVDTDCSYQPDEQSNSESVKLMLDSNHKNSDASETNATAPSTQAKDNSELCDSMSINPTLQNLHYSWPLHTINADFKDVNPEDSFYLVYRNALDKVQFMQTNALTHSLVAYIEQHQPVSRATEDLSDLLTEFANSLGFAEVDVVINFGLPLIHQLIEQDVILHTKAC